MKITVKTVRELTEEQEKKIREIFGDEVIIDSIIDESIVGGIYIKVKDQMFDGTVTTILEDLRLKLIKE